MSQIKKAINNEFMSQKLIEKINMFWKVFSLSSSVSSYIEILTVCTVSNSTFFLSVKKNQTSWVDVVIGAQTFTSFCQSNSRKNLWPKPDFR